MDLKEVDFDKISRDGLWELSRQQAEYLRKVRREKEKERIIEPQILVVKVEGMKEDDLRKVFEKYGDDIKSIDAVRSAWYVTLKNELVMEQILKNEWTWQGHILHLESSMID